MRSGFRRKRGRRSSIPPERSRGPRRAEQDRAPLQNLPRQLTSFLGRDEVVQEIADLVATTPLVSIVGTGGAGKTRAAVEVGMRVANPIPARRLVRRARTTQRSRPGPARSCDSVTRSRVAAALSARNAVRLSRAQTSADHSRQLRTHHLAGAGGGGIAAARMPERRFAGDESRGPERHRGANLSNPASRRSRSKAGRRRMEAAKYGAVALFADRVRAADSRFELTAENVKAVVEICRRLDGLPLALELAAARASVLSPQEICDRLDRVFDVLTGGRRKRRSRVTQRCAR